MEIIPNRAFLYFGMLHCILNISNHYDNLQKKTKQEDIITLLREDGDGVGMCLERTTTTKLELQCAGHLKESGEDGAENQHGKEL